MNYNEINLVIIDKRPIITPDEIFPSISNIFTKCTLMHSLNEIKLIDIINNKNTFYFFKNRECTSLNEKIKSFFISICGKKFRSPFCSYKKIISNTLLEDKHKFKIITLSTFHFFDLLKFHTQQYQRNTIHFDFSTAETYYLWNLDLLNNRKNYHTALCIIYNCYSYSFLRYLSKIYPNAKIISRYHDMIINKKHKAFITNNNNKLKNITFETYALKDSQELKINYWPNSVSIKYLIDLNSAVKPNQFDIYFLGVSNPTRLNFLKNLFLMVT